MQMVEKRLSVKPRRQPFHHGKGLCRRVLMVRRLHRVSGFGFRVSGLGFRV